MRLTIVNGFFLPVPPASGGATEKTWHRLSREFAARGHAVTMISRCWHGYPDEETLDSVRHLRLQGYNHRRVLWQNLWLDFLWSCRVYRALPPADIVVANTVSLPVWLGRCKPRAGRVVVLPGRMPKGQYRRYHRIARVIAPSTHVAGRVAVENPALAPRIRVCGYPIDWTLLQSDAPLVHPLIPAGNPGEVTLGFVGRIHEEKGLMLLADALRLVHATPDLPPWRLLLCGPSDVARGGSGADFRGRLLHQLSQAVPGSRFHLLEPQFNDRVLAALYRSMDIFCYPSLAVEGETFGVAVAEAMAAGAVPVVSALACFRDFVQSDRNGLAFNHAAPDAPAQLAAALVRLLREPDTRRRLATAAQADVQRYDYPTFAGTLLADFATLAGD